MSMDRLPIEITSDIFSRLPFKSLFHSCFVCKTWHTIISNPSFPLSRASTINPDLILYRYRYPNQSEIYLAEKNEENDTVIKFKQVHVPFIIDLNHPDKANHIMGSCNGLLCLSLRVGSGRNIHIYNPITGEHQQLPYCIGNNKWASKYMSGLGYDVSMQEFKLVMVFFSYNMEQLPALHLEKEVYVYTLGCKAWRRKNYNVPNLSFPAGHVHASFVFTNESLHWIAADYNSSNPNKRVILSFHLGVEEFTVLPTPYSIGVNLSDPFKSCSLGVLDGHLSLVDSYSKQYVDIWVAKDYGGKMSWKKQFSVRRYLIHPSSGGLIRPLQVLENGEILLMCGFCRLVAYNPKSKKCRSLKVDKTMRSFEPVLFVASFISIKSGFGMDSDVEKFSCRKRKQPS